MKKYYKYIVILVLIFVFPTFVFGAVLSIQSTSPIISVGDTIVLRVTLDTERQTINAVDGEIFLETKNADYVIEDINTASSNFSLWPKSPVLSPNGKTISFVGGVPGGINDNDVQLFNIVIQAKKPGEIILRKGDIEVYLNDGKGTALTPVFTQFSVNITSTSGTPVPESEAGTGSIKQFIFAGIIILIAIVFLFYKIRHKKQNVTQK